MKRKLICMIAACTLLFASAPIHSFAGNDTVQIQSITSTVKQGGEIIISGISANTDTFVLSVFAPNNMIVETRNVTPESNLTFQVKIRLTEQAPIGTYTVLYGSNNIKKTFTVTSNVADTNSGTTGSDTTSTTPNNPTTPTNGNTKPTDTVEETKPSVELTVVEKKNESGTTIITIDETKAIESITKSDSSNFKVPIKQTGDILKIETELSSSIFEAMGKKSGNAVLSIESDKAAYDLPVKAINLEQLRKDLGIETTAKLDVNIKIEETPKTVTDAANQAATSVGSKVLINPIDFTIEVSSNGKSAPITNFGQTFVNRSLTLNASQVNTQKSTGVVYLPDATVKYRHVPTKFILNSDGSMKVDLKRNGNSIYTVLENNVSFQDVADNHWAKQNIELMASKLILQGMENKQFKPNDTITRAQFATIVVRALGLMPEKYNLNFKDVDKVQHSWFIEELQAAHNAKLVNGRTENTFDPNAPVTRQEMAKIIGEAIAYTGKSIAATDSEISSKLASFTDSNLVAGYAKPYMAYAIEHQIIQGKPGAKLDPAGNATRAEASTIVLRMLQSLDFVNK